MSPFYAAFNTTLSTTICSANSSAVDSTELSAKCRAQYPTFFAAIGTSVNPALCSAFGTALCTTLCSANCSAVYST